MLPQHMVERYQLRKGTMEGEEFFPPYLVAPVTLYAPDAILGKMFKNVYSKVQFDDITPFGKIVINGAQFLQQNIIFIPLGTRGNCDGTFIYPYRATGRLLAKLYMLANRLLTPQEMLLRMTAFGFLAMGNRPLHARIGEIYQAYKDHHGINMDNEAISLEGDKKFSDWRYKLGEISALDMINYPSYDRVVEFYSITEDVKRGNRNYILASNPNRAYFPGLDYMVVKRASKPRKVDAELMAEATADLNSILDAAMLNGGRIKR